MAKRIGILFLMFGLCWLAANVWPNSRAWAGECKLQRGAGGELVPRIAAAAPAEGGPIVVIADTKISLWANLQDGCPRQWEESLNKFFRPAGVRSKDTFVFWDVRYDEEAGVYFIYAVTHNLTTGRRTLYLAHSIDGNDWDFSRKRIDGLSCAGAPTDSIAFFDAHAGLDHDRLYLNFDVYGSSSTTGSLLDIDKDSVLAGGPIKLQCFKQLPVFTIPPVVQGDTAGGKSYFISSPISGTAIKRFSLNVADTVASDTLVPMPDIAVSDIVTSGAATQPNGLRLNTFSGIMRNPSIQDGKFLWNAHTVNDDNGHPKVRLYVFSADSNAPVMTKTISTLPSGLDDTFGASLLVNDTDVFVTFTRTVESAPINGRATLMMASGPRFRPGGWTITELARSPGEISKDSFGSACSPVGCVYTPTSVTLLDPDGSAFGIGEIITKGAVGGAGSEENWTVGAFKPF